MMRDHSIDSCAPIVTKYIIREGSGADVLLCFIILTSKVAKRQANTSIYVNTHVALDRQLTKAIP